MCDNIENLTGALKYCKFNGWMEGATIDLTINQNDNKCSIQINNIKLENKDQLMNYLSSNKVFDMDVDEFDDLLLLAKTRNQQKAKSFALKKWQPNPLPSIFENSIEEYNTNKFSSGIIFPKIYLPEITKNLLDCH